MSFQPPYINISNPLHRSNRFYPTFDPEMSSDKVKLLAVSPNHQPPIQPPFTLHSSTNERYTTRVATQLPCFLPTTFQQSLRIYLRTDGYRKLGLLVPTAVAHSLTHRLARSSRAGMREYVRERRSYGECTLLCRQQDTSWLSFVMRWEDVNDRFSWGVD